MQGAIHDKSRMRTRRRNTRPQPVYTLDMAVAYTFRILPPTAFTSTLVRDLPRCQDSNFDGSLILSVKGIKAIYESSEKAKDDDLELVDNIDAEEGAQESEPSAGIVKTYIPGRSGSIEPDEGGPDADFQINNVEVSYQGKIAVGDRVTFIDHRTRTGGRLALHVAKIAIVQQIDGIVKSYEAGEFGFIEVSDGGPDAFFFAADINGPIRNELKPGDRVLFDIMETTKRRQGINISRPQVPRPIRSVQLDELASYVVSYVKSSVMPVSMAKLAYQIRSHFGDNISNTQWFGYGTFKNLLLQLDLENLDISSVGPSYVYYPAVHQRPTGGDLSLKPKDDADDAGQGHLEPVKPAGPSIEEFAMHYPE